MVVKKPYNLSLVCKFLPEYRILDEHHREMVVCRSQELPHIDMHQIGNARFHVAWTPYINRTASITQTVRLKKPLKIESILEERRS